MNLDMLKGKLVEKGKTYREGANAIGCSVGSFNNKMQGRVAFDCSEATTLADWLLLTTQEKLDIFLSDN